MMSTMKFLFLTATLFLISSCVSVNLPLSPKYAKSKNVSFKQPASPFKTQSIENNNLDAYWISENTKSTIGFYSICTKVLPPLRNARSNSLNGVDSPEIIKEELITFNEREALKSTIQGKLEGFVFWIDSVLFVKDSCLFEISYVAYKENYEKEKEIFNNFLKDFKVR